MKAFNDVGVAVFWRRAVVAIKLSFKEGIPFPRLGWFLFAVVAVLAGYAQYAPYGQELPIGCDEFGYLNMAKSLDESELFENHAQRPFATDLIEDLKAEFPDSNAFRWMIAPHAYHLGPNDSKIINQYPPGVALLLAPFSLDIRRVAFPAVCIALWCCAIAFAARMQNGVWTWLGIGLATVVGSILISFEPVRIELQRVNSLAPTFGLLVAAGWLLPRHPLVAIGLLSATTVFRLPNIILALPFVVAYLASGLSQGREYWIKVVPSKILRAIAVFLLAGFGLYLAYAWRLLGNPLLPTYSSIDQEFSGWEKLGDNLRFYLVEQRSWLGPHIAAIGMLAISCACSKKWKWMVFGLSVVAYNYGFFLFHNVQIYYYPYASVFVVVGLACGVLDPRRLNRIAVTMVHAMAILAMAAILLRIDWPTLQTRQKFSREIEKYETTFVGFDVIWAEVRSGTIEYATNIAGFRYVWGSGPTRAYVIKWLEKRDYTQAIWLDDIGMPEREEIAEFLSEHMIRFELTSTEALGDMLVLFPDDES